MQPISIGVRGAADMIGVGRTKFYQLINEGKVETVKLGGQRLVKVASLHALLSRAA